MNTWEPSSFEDQLLQEHFTHHPGTAYLEFAVSPSGQWPNARRIDAVLIPGARMVVRRPGEYSIEEATAAIAGQHVHVIEAKRALNRGVIGQVLVAEYLVRAALEPARVATTVVCSRGNQDLEDFCRHAGIEVHFYSVPEEGNRPPAVPAEPCERADLRQAPDEPRRRAFLAGWTQAVNGHLFGSVRRRKTHANMGNLFGWIHGDKPDEFRLETWRRYAESSATGDTNEQCPA